MPERNGSLGVGLAKGGVDLLGVSQLGDQVQGDAGEDGLLLVPKYPERGRSPLPAAGRLDARVAHGRDQHIGDAIVIVLRVVSNRGAGKVGVVGTLEVDCAAK